MCVQGHLLLAQERGASNTFLPGGHIETGEPATVALVREFSEEMGIRDVVVGRFLGAVEHAWPDKLPNHFQINLVFAVGSAELDALLASGQTPQSNESHLQFSWVPLVEIGQHNLLPPPMEGLILESTRVPGWATTMMDQQVLSDGDVRLRVPRVDEYVACALPWYQDAEVLDLSESGASPFDAVQVRRMFSSISRQGEVFLIEVRDQERWVPIGDASLLEDATPIVIGAEAWRSKGVGTRVLRLMIERARATGRTSLPVSGIDERNHRSLALFQRAGFLRTGVHHDERGHVMIEMRLDLNGKVSSQ